MNDPSPELWAPARASPGLQLCNVEAVLLGQAKATPVPSRVPHVQLPPALPLLRRPRCGGIYSTGREPECERAPGMRIQYPNAVSSFPQINHGLTLIIVLAWVHTGLIRKMSVEDLLPLILDLSFLILKHV